MRNLKISELNRSHLKYLTLALLFNACDWTSSENSNCQRPAGFYEIIIDRDHRFCHFSYLVKDDNHSVMGIAFEDYGKFNLYNIYKNSRQIEFKDDLVYNKEWEMKGDTLIIYRAPVAKLIYIKELDCFATSDLSLLIKKQ